MIRSKRTSVSTVPFSFSFLSTRASTVHKLNTQSFYTFREDRLGVCFAVGGCKNYLQSHSQKGGVLVSCLQQANYTQIIGPLFVLRCESTIHEVTVCHYQALKFRSQVQRPPSLVKKEDYEHNCNSCAREKLRDRKVW